MKRIDVEELGEYIREQRKLAEMSLRQLAASAEVSNPYLSQIERGMRKPSAEILFADFSGDVIRPSGDSG